MALAKMSTTKVQGFKKGGLVDRRLGQFTICRPIYYLRAEVSLHCYMCGVNGQRTARTLNILMAKIYVPFLFVLCAPHCLLKELMCGSLQQAALLQLLQEDSRCESVAQTKTHHKVYNLHVS